MNPVPAWVEVATAALVVASGLAAVVASLGFVRLSTLFERMHPPALASTFGVWAIVLASILYFSALEGVPVLHSWVIPILLAITVPVTTVLLARAAIFRKRRTGMDVPPPFTG